MESEYTTGLLIAAAIVAVCYFAGLLDKPIAWIKSTLGESFSTGPSFFGISRSQILERDAPTSPNR